MAYYRAQLDVRRPIDEVFAYLADFSNTEEWDPGVISAKKRGEGPVAVGTEFKVVSRFLGQELPRRDRPRQRDHRHPPAGVGRAAGQVEPARSGEAVGHPAEGGEAVVGRGPVEGTAPSAAGRGQVLRGEDMLDANAPPHVDTVLGQPSQHAVPEGDPVSPVLTLRGRGRGVDEDLLEAYRWYNRAVAGGDEEARRGLSELAQRLSAEQLRAMEQD